MQRAFKWPYLPNNLRTLASKLASPFGRSTHVCMQVHISQLAPYLLLRLTRDLGETEEQFKPNYYQ